MPSDEQIVKHVAEKVMRWDAFHFSVKTPILTRWNPLADWSAAAELLERAPFWTIRKQAERGFGETEYYARVQWEGFPCEAKAETAQRAICLAAYRATGGAE